MAFSIRTFFGKDKSDDPGTGTPASASNGSPGSPSPMSAPNPFQPAESSQPPNQFGGGLLFKTTPGAEPLGQPVGSPFSPAAAAAPVGLTVGDVLSQLPPDVARNNNLSPAQPLAVPDDVMDRALRSGKAALPLFEIYRVCPALFQTPVSPQDTRLVPLPPHKIPQLLGNSGSAPAPEQQQPASPFNLPTVPGQTASPFSLGGPFGSPAVSGPEPAATAASPFGIAPAITSSSPFQVADSRPPSQPPAFSFGDKSPAEPPAATPLQNGTHPGGPPTNPFAQAPTATSASVPEQPPSPFGMMMGSAPAGDDPGLGQPRPAAPTPPAQSDSILGENSPNPFGLPTAAPGSNPFSASPVPAWQPPAAQPPPVDAAGPSPTPFSFLSSEAPAQPASAPFPGFPPMPAPPAAELPAPPKAEPAPAPPAPPTDNPFARIQALGATSTPPPAPAPAPAPAATALPPPKHVIPMVATAKTSEESAPEESVRMSLAAVLKDTPEAALGLNPELIPSWVQVALPVASLRQQVATGKVAFTIEALRQGLEPEYRNLIGAAHPDHVVALPMNEVFHALPAGSTQPVEEPPVPAPAPPAEPEAFTPAPAWEPPPWEPPDFSPPPADFAKTLSAQPELAPLAPAPPEPPPASVFASAPVAKPVDPAPSSTPPARGARRGRDKDRQLLLRVLLGCHEELDTAGIVRQLGRQPGVSAVVLLRADRVLASASNDSAEATHFIRQAQGIHQHLEPLVSLTGIEETETLSIRGEQSIVTFSMQSPIALGVLHDLDHQESSLLEKVTLLARELAGMTSA